VLAALWSEAGSAFALETEAKIRARSPTAVAVTFRHMRAGARLDFDDCLWLELRIAN